MSGGESSELRRLRAELEAMRASRSQISADNVRLQREAQDMRHRVEATPNTRSFPYQSYGLTPDEPDDLISRWRASRGINHSTMSGDTPNGTNAEGGSDAPEELTEEQMKEYMDPQTEAVIRDMQQRKAETDNKVSLMAEEFTRTFERKMGELSEKYRVHAEENIGNRRGFVIKWNKILRDVSRGLGDDWIDVYSYLLATTGVKDVQQQFDLLEQEPKVIRPYKALVKWKEMKGDDFDIKELVEALQVSGRSDLADTVRQILYADNQDVESFITYTPAPGVLRTVTSEHVETTSLGPLGLGEVDPSMTGRRRLGLEEEGTTGSKISAPLGDRKLMQLAKKMGKEWWDLGLKLDIPEEELNEIRLADVERYQNAFKMLYAWKDKTIGTPDFNMQNLAAALEAVGRADLAEFALEK